MTARTFVDTNVLIYAYDRDAGHKHDVAAAVVAGLWEQGTGVLSLQVLQEFYVNVTRKIPLPLAPAEARGIIESYVSWVRMATGGGTLLLATEIEQRHRLSFWDSLILAAALESGATRLLSEDFQTGRRIEGILVENPFLDRQRKPRVRPKE